MSITLEKALADLIEYVERNECQHESVHRGGAIWTICDECGEKWADDQGGYIPYQEPPVLAAARGVLASPPPSVPTGYKLVPEEPTEEMLLAAYKQSVASLLNDSGNAHCKTDEERSAHTVRPLYRAMLVAAPPATAQCCMCGKTGLSTVEGDGGAECELSDGRWVCSQDCYDLAVDPPALRREALEELAKIATSLGCADDPYAAWEKLDAILAALRFYGDRRSYMELPAEDAARLYGKPPDGMVHRPGYVTYAASKPDNAVPLIFSDWGEKARALIPSEEK